MKNLNNLQKLYGVIADFVQIFNYFPKFLVILNLEVLNKAQGVQLMNTIYAPNLLKLVGKIARQVGNSWGHWMSVSPLQLLRNALDSWEITDRQTAELLAKTIPAQCPFERDVVLFGKTIAHIPPLCKLNPVYDQLVGLRFRALCYLADQCGVDIQAYC